MNIDSFGEKNIRNGNTSTLLSSEFCTTPEFENLSQWVRLGASHARSNPACIEEHRQKLRAQGETEKRLDELDHWRQSIAFTEREKAALALSETVSLPESEEQSTLILKDAGRFFNIHQIVRLTLKIIAVNDWIDLRES